MLLAKGQPIYHLNTIHYYSSIWHGILGGHCPSDSCIRERIPHVIKSYFYTDVYSWLSLL